MSRLSLSSFIAAREAENGTKLPDLACLLGGFYGGKAEDRQVGQKWR
jgi:hypothetical protein